MSRALLHCLVVKIGSPNNNNVSDAHVFCGAGNRTDIARIFWLI